MRFLHIDGNTFYASVHRVFEPMLRGKPIIVLSNNDGCVVTRTAEAKALGIKRGVPLFQIKDLVEKHQIVVRSSNYELYQSMSNRMMATIRTLVPRQEIYSIDEQFADVTGMTLDLTTLGHQVHDRVLKWTGIPTCVGIASTKTLAKLCDYYAKIYPVFQSVLNWDDLTPARQAKAWRMTPIGEVWGIGGALTAKLQAVGVATVMDFVRLPRTTVRKFGGVVLERTWLELQGEVCIPLVETPPKRQQIVRSRSFGELITDKESVLSAVSVHVASAARILRKEGTETTRLTVQFQSDPFRTDEPQYFANPTFEFERPTSDTLFLTHTACSLVDQAWKCGFKYRRAGVIFSQLVEEGSPILSQSLFDDPSIEMDRARRRKLMSVMDALTDNYGKTILQTASAVLSDKWQMKRDYLSPCYTTNWDDLLTVS